MGENICGKKYFSWQGLVSRIYLELNNKKQTTQFLKWIKDLKKFHQIRYKMVNKYMKTCSTSPVFRKMQIETVRYYLHTYKGDNYLKKQKGK